MAPLLTSGYDENQRYRPLGIYAYGFNPYTATQEENDTEHGNDERIRVEEVRRGFRVMYDVVTRWRRSRKTKPRTRFTMNRGPVCDLVILCSFYRNTFRTARRCSCRSCRRCSRRLLGAAACDGLSPDSWREDCSGLAIQNSNSWRIISLRIFFFRIERWAVIEIAVEKILGLAAFFLDFRAKRNQPMRTGAHVFKAVDAGFGDLFFRVVGSNLPPSGRACA